MMGLLGYNTIISQGNACTSFTQDYYKGQKKYNGLCFIYK